MDTQHANGVPENLVYDNTFYIMPGLLFVDLSTSGSGRWQPNCLRAMNVERIIRHKPTGSQNSQRKTDA